MKILWRPLKRKKQVIDFSNIDLENIDLRKTDYSKTDLSNLDMSEIGKPTKKQKSKKLFWDYYSPEIRPRAIRLFGPFMERFGYDFPKDWNSDLRRIDYFNYSLSINLKLLFYKMRVHPQL